MSPATYQFQPIEAVAGIDKDNTSLSTQHYTDATNIRFVNGRPQKIGGHDTLTITGTKAILGCARTLYSQLVGTVSTPYTLIGTHLNLYSLNSTTLTNVTPLVSTLITLGTDPVATTNTSVTIVITQTAHGLSNGATVILKGSAAVNGVPAAEINTSHTISNVTTNTYDIVIITAATGTGSGGGSAVTVETQAVKLTTRTTLGTDPLDSNTSTTVTVNQTAHNLTTGATIRMEGAVAFDSLVAGELNNTHDITNPTTNDYDIIVSTAATASNAGGGSAVIIEHSNITNHFQTLANDPVATVLSSTTLTITSTAHVLESGDIITLAGSAAVNGVPAVEINTQQIIRSTNTNDYTITVSTAATSTGSGGGAAVTEGSSVLTVTKTAHGYTDGDRVKISESTSGPHGGITDIELNTEHIIRNKTTNTYDIVVTTNATASNTAVGGPFITDQEQIADGVCDASFGMGYGVGLYGIGLYGVSKIGSVILGTPRIYSNDRFGNNLVLTPGDQTAVYEWTGSITTAPEELNNAPSTVSFVFVSDNIVVTLGAAGVINRVQWSAQGNSNLWVSTVALPTTAGDDDIEGANEFISQIHVRGVNLLFTKDQVWTMRFIGGQFIWEFKQIDVSDGLIGQNARATHNGIVYWMGNDDFFLYSGGVVKPIPSNSGINYVRDFVFTDIDTTQSSKCFAWYNKRFSEIWFHYPSASSTEPNKVVRFSTKELHWTPDSIDRTAAENPRNIVQFPYLIDSSNVIFRHEKGVDDNGAALSWTLTTKVYQFNNGTDTTDFDGIIPDSTQTGDITVTFTGREYIQDSASEVTKVLTVTPTSGKVDLDATVRNWQYEMSQSVIGGNWRSGNWHQRVKTGSPK